MNEKTAQIAAVAIIAGGTIVAVTKWQSYINDLAGRFPHLNRKVIRKAYLKFLIGSAAGVYGDMETLSDEAMDTIFLSLVKETPTSK